MARVKPDPEGVDHYLSKFQGEARKRLEKLRQVISENAPEAIEKMSYGVPAFYLNGNLIVYAAFKHHVGIYPTPSAIEAFMEKLKGFETSKGTIKFPLDKPMPYDLVAEITQYRVREQQVK